MIALIALLGAAAGVLTTLAGLGGGMALMVALSLLQSPTVALASTAPALLLGNVHRMSMFREQVDRRVAVAFAVGAMPGALVGGLLAAALPETVLRCIMVAMTAAALTRALGWWRWQPPAASLVPAGFAIGAVAATSGGAGLLAGPLLMAAGLRGEAYVATSAAAAASMHVGRLLAYGFGGLFDERVLVYAAVLSVTILGGNLLGKHLRAVIGPAQGQRIEMGAMVLAVGLAMAGLGR